MVVGCLGCLSTIKAPKGHSVPASTMQQGQEVCQDNPVVKAARGKPQTAQYVFSSRPGGFITRKEVASSKGSWTRVKASGCTGKFTFFEIPCTGPCTYANMCHFEGQSTMHKVEPRLANAINGAAIVVTASMHVSCCPLILYLCSYISWLQGALLGLLGCALQEPLRLVARTLCQAHIVPASYHACPTSKRYAQVIRARKVSW